MKNLAIVGVVAAVLGFGMTALAADTNSPEFYAVSEVAADSNLQAMSDSQLTTVEGMSWMRHNDCGCRGTSYTSIYQSNSLSQLNFNLGGKRSDVYQTNSAYQGNVAIVK